MRLLLALLFVCMPLAARAEGELAFGIVEELHSQRLGESRTLNIFLPSDYAHSQASHPVVYLLDGAANEDWFHAATLLDYMASYGMCERAIVVGIANVDRYRDFTEPSRNAEDRQNLPTSGGAQAFLDFLEQELVPYVEANYRCTDQRTLIGQSMGGLLAAQVLLERPDSFQRYLIVSPSLWWNDGRLHADMGRLLAATGPAERSVYLSVGAEHPTMVSMAADFAQALRECTWPGLRLQYDHLTDENHATALHISIYRGLRFFSDFDAAAEKP